MPADSSRMRSETAPEPAPAPPAPLLGVGDPSLRGEPPLGADDPAWGADASPLRGGSCLGAKASPLGADASPLRADVPPLRPSSPSLDIDASLLRADVPALGADAPVLRADASPLATGSPPLRADAPPRDTGAPPLGAEGPPPGAPALRVDARRNRARLLTAAREVFAERGLDAPMATVARRAGVGVATLYRRFPTRDDLVRAAFAEQMKTCGRVLDEAVADPDPWRGFRRLVETVCALQVEERGFPEAFVRAFPDTARAQTGEARAQAAEDFGRLVARAQAAGALRPDFHPADFSMLLLAHGGLVAAAPADRASSRRLVAYFLESFRARPSRTPLPAPGSLDLFAGPIPHDETLPGGRGA